MCGVPVHFISVVFQATLVLVGPYERAHFSAEFT